MKRDFKLKWIGIVAFIMTISLILTGCRTLGEFTETFIEKGDVTEDTIKIGVFEPLSGPDSEEAAHEILGIQIANELFPTCLGKKVELVYEDNKGDTAGAKAAAERLVNQGVTLVLGSYGSATSLVGGEVFSEAMVPAIGITCTNALVTSANDYYSRVCFVNTFQGIAMAKYAAENLDAKVAATISDSIDSYSVAVAQAFITKFQTATGDPYSVKSITRYNHGDTEFTKQIEHIKSQNPDVIFIPGTAEDTALIMGALRDAGVTAQFMGLSGHETDILTTAAGDAAEGMTFATLFDSSSELTENTSLFLTAYKARYGENAVPNSYTALGFDAYMLAIDSINKAGEGADGEGIQTAIVKTKQYQGVTGEMTFDGKGDPTKSTIIKKVENGQFKYADTIVPVWGPVE